MLDLTPNELQTLAGLIDAGVRQAGIRALSDEALSIVKKIDAAARVIPPKVEPEVGVG